MQEKTFSVSKKMVHEMFETRTFMLWFYISDNPGEQLGVQFKIMKRRI